ncbi:MAG TPA: CoA ester lyase [Geminicoccaceae bacterium]|nr:CoA ester lyase [Geminicoccaceae bacterium]
MTDTLMMRSKLFVPGSRPELFAKALAGDADGVSFDLEDAVQEDRKAEAQAAVGELLQSLAPSVTEKIILVRVNGPDTPHFTADVAAVAWPGLDLLNLPKVEAADDVRAAAAALGRLEGERGIDRPIGILANIESPRGLRRATEIAAADPRVAGLQVGYGDLFEPLGIDRSDAAAVHQIQLLVRLAAGEAGLWACDAAFPAVDDSAGFTREAVAARRLGYVGKTCIHPSQVALANEAFRPSEQEIARALRVVAAAREAALKGLGAFLVDGRMIDAPFARRAEAVVALARRLGLVPVGSGSEAWH